MSKSSQVVEIEVDFATMSFRRNHGKPFCDRAGTTTKNRTSPRPESRLASRWTPRAVPVRTDARPGMGRRSQQVAGYSNKA
jgi:hypothetical protein